MIYFITNQTRFLEGLENNSGIKGATIQDVYNYFRHKKQVEVDFETEGFDPYIHEPLTLQLGDFYKQFVIDLTTVPIVHVKPLLESDKLFLLQNAKFDLRFCMHKGINIKKVYDTFLAECILTTGYQNRNLALDDLGAKYAGAKLDKSVRGEIHRGLSARVITYAAHDVKYLSKIKDGQMAHLVKYGLANPKDTQDKYTVLGLENRVVRVFAAMEYHGVNIDPEKWKKNSIEIKKEYQKQIEILDTIVQKEEKLKKFVPRVKQGILFDYEERLLDINYNSSQQKVKILNALGFKVDSSADRILQKLQDKHAFIKELRRLNKLSKLNSSFGFKLLEKAYHPVTGRFHPTYWQILQTGRISVSEPNTNQIPARGKFGPIIRSAFTAPEGKKIVGGDYSAMELRELAQFSKDPLWLKIFKEGQDLHTVLCAQTFNIPEEDVRKPYPNNPTITYRDIQKTINYG
jgi:DNA polymerase I-like protein with 3'-5' exonuclease and polymerase domains